MPIVPNFSTSQAAGNLGAMTITDTSTGSDGTLTGRIIRLREYDGTYLVPTGYTVNFISWPIGSSSLTVEDLLDKDYCLDITVTFYAGSTAAYTKTILTLFTGYSDVFLRQLTQNAGANRGLIAKKNFYNSKNELRTLIDDAAQAVELLNDQTIAQFCLDDAKKLTDNISTFF
jgi:hypothetical protein